MSEENVALVVHLGDALTRGDVDAYVEGFDPDGQVVDPPDVPGATTHQGHDSIRRFAQSFTRFWTEFRLDTDEVTAVGDDRVFAHDRAAGVGRTSGVEVVRPFQLVASVRNGRLMEVRFYGSRREALKAAGLSE